MNRVGWAWHGPNWCGCVVNSLVNKAVNYSLRLHAYTGKSFSEVLILASTNPQYDKRLFIDLHISSVHENYKLSTCCVHKLF